MNEWMNEREFVVWVAVHIDELFEGVDITMTAAAADFADSVSHSLHSS